MNSESFYRWTSFLDTCNSNASMYVSIRWVLMLCHKMIIFIFLGWVRMQEYTRARGSKMEEGDEELNGKEPVQNVDVKKEKTNENPNIAPSVTPSRSLDLMIRDFGISCKRLVVDFLREIGILLLISYQSYYFRSSDVFWAWNDTCRDTLSPQSV